MEYNVPVLGARQFRIDARVKLLQAGHNAQQPINKLPIEIFSNILELVIFYPESNARESIEELSLVCKTWRGIVCNTSGLWTMIHFGDPPPFLQECIRRSGQLPLTVKIIEPPQILEKEEIDDVLKMCTGRIRSLEYIGDDDSDTRIVQAYIDTTTNLKVHRYTHNLDPTEIAEVEKLAITSGDPIRFLHLYDVYLTTCDWDRLKHLEILKLEQFGFGSPSSFSGLLNALISSTGLRELTLAPGRFYQEESIDFTPPTSISIHLPVLHSLTVVAERYPFMAKIRNLLSVPVCSELDLHENLTDNSIWDWLARNVGPSICDTSEVVIKINLKSSFVSFRQQDYLRWDLGTGGALHVEGVLPILSRLGRMLKDHGYMGRMGLRFFVVIIEQPTVFNADTLLSVLDDLPELKWIEAYGKVEMPSLLRTLEAVRTGPYSWDCPPF